MDLKKQATQCLGSVMITGIDGLQLSSEQSYWFSEVGIGGVLLFSKNYSDRTQLIELTSSLQESRGKSLPLWICVDQEGGRVQRFKSEFTRIPSAESIGERDAPSWMTQLSAIVASELFQAGVNVNFAPVADIMTNPSNPVIGDRAYGKTPEKVSRMVVAWIQGHLRSKVVACMKHFPGHGDTHLDSHFDLPRVETTWEVLRMREFEPFRKGIEAGCPMIMTSHILNRHLDEVYPATLSRHVLMDILRNELGFQGLIVSDDLEMQAISDHFGTQQGAILALAAGCDLVVFRTFLEAKKSYEACLKAIETDHLDPVCILRASQRNAIYKEKLILPKKQ